MLIITCQNSEQVFAEFMDRKFVIENKNNLNEFSATIKNCLNDLIKKYCWMIYLKKLLN